MHIRKCIVFNHTIGKIYLAYKYTKGIASIRRRRSVLFEEEVYCL